VIAMNNKPRFVGEKVRLGDVCEVVSGATPKTKNEAFWGGDIKWVTPAELDDDTHYVSDTSKHLTEEGFASASLHMLPKGTVLLTTRAPIGKVAIAANEMCCNQGFKNLICSEAVNNEYLYRYLKSRSAELQAMGRGATFKELSKKNVTEYRISLPARSRQEEAVAKLETVERQIVVARKQIEKLDQLVKSRFVAQQQIEKLQVLYDSLAQDYFGD
jgi:type I restriction enzyme, S subunit